MLDLRKLITHHGLYDDVINIKFGFQSIDTIPYDTRLEAPFAHSLHSVYFRKSTPCCLPRLTFEPKPLRQVGKFRPTKLN